MSVRAVVTQTTVEEHKHPNRWAEPKQLFEEERSRIPPDCCAGLD